MFRAPEREETSSNRIPNGPKNDRRDEDQHSQESNREEPDVLAYAENPPPPPIADGGEPPVVSTGGEN